MSGFQVLAYVGTFLGGVATAVVGIVAYAYTKVPDHD